MGTFADRLKEAMEFRNFRQVDLAALTHIDKGTISNYLSGKYEPKNANAYLIAEALNVNLPWLLGHDVPMEINQYVDYSETQDDGSYLTIEWEEDIDSKITREKWNSYYDMLMEMPQSMRLETLKAVMLMEAMFNLRKNMEDNSKKSFHKKGG